MVALDAPSAYTSNGRVKHREPGRAPDAGRSASPSASASSRHPLLRHLSASTGSCGPIAISCAPRPTRRLPQHALHHPTPHLDSPCHPVGSSEPTHSFGSSLHPMSRRARAPPCLRSLSLRLPSLRPQPGTHACIYTVPPLPACRAGHSLPPNASRLAYTPSRAAAACTPPCQAPPLALGIVTPPRAPCLAGVHRRGACTPLRLRSPPPSHRPPLAHPTAHTPPAPASLPYS
ncbi:hypothetical protein K438DRAFT_1990558 [Mycena galopus ATCC 62051]|nr:hypothetical protein K438DRAFT_1990558 [Mycena galopus ATCC 62051]